MTVDDNGYVTTKYTETNAQELAQALIKQAKTINYNPQSKTADKDGTTEGAREEARTSGTFIRT